MDLKVDVVDNNTGEIKRRSVLLANAHIYIAKRDGILMLDHVVEGERFLYVEFPDTVRAEKEWAAQVGTTREFWQLEQRLGRPVRK